jgi:hypothetical protein
LKGEVNGAGKGGIDTDRKYNMVWSPAASRWERVVILVVGGVQYDVKEWIDMCVRMLVRSLALDDSKWA